MVFSALETSRQVLAGAGRTIEDALSALGSAGTASAACDPRAASACAEMLDAWSAQLRHLHELAVRLADGTAGVEDRYRSVDGVTASSFHG